MLKKILIGGIGALIGLYLTIGWIFTTMLLTPERSSFDGSREKSLARSGFDYQVAEKQYAKPETVTIEGVEGAQLKAWYYQQSKQPSCAIIYSHGWGGNRSAGLKFKPLMEDCECDFLAYDQRAHNESSGDYGTGGILEAKDLLKITDWLKTKTGLPDNRIGWIGTSWGGATVLQAGGQSQRNMAFILADSPFDNWYTATTERSDKWFGKWTRIFFPLIKFFVKQRAGVDYDSAACIDHVPNIKAPVFLIHSEGDTETNSQQSVNISKVLPQNSVFHHTQWGSDHTRDIINHFSKYKGLWSEFMIKYVPTWGSCETGMPVSPSLSIK